MRKLTEKELDNMTAAELAEHFRLEARREIEQKRLEKANAAKFEAIVTPYIERGIPFNEFMAAEQCPSSFREAYRQIEERHRRAHTKSQEQTELEQLESEVQAAMGISSDDPQQQAEPTGYAGRDYFSAWAQFSQAEKDRERRHSLQG